MRKELGSLAILTAGLAAMALLAWLDAVNEADAIGLLTHIANIHWRLTC